MPSNKLSGKQYWFIYLFLCFPLPYSLEAQAVIELEKSNFLVAGLDNPLSIIIEDLPDSCLVLQPSIGSITREGKAYYYMWHGLVLDSTIVTLKLFDACHDTLLGERTYRVREIPTTASLGRYWGGTVDTGAFKGQGGICIWMQDGPCGNCETIGFTAQFTSKKTGETWTGYNTGLRLEGTVLQKQQAVQPGDHVVFSQILYRCPGMAKPKYYREILRFKMADAAQSDDDKYNSKRWD